MNSITHLDRFIARSFTPPLALARSPDQPIAGSSSGLPGSSTRSVPASPAHGSQGLPPRRAISTSPSLRSIPLPSSSSFPPADHAPFIVVPPPPLKRRRSGAPTRPSRPSWLIFRFLAKLWAFLVGVALWCSGGQRGLGFGTAAASGRGRATSVSRNGVLISSRRRIVRETLTSESMKHGRDRPVTASEDTVLPSNAEPFPDPRTQAVDPSLSIQSPMAEVPPPINFTSAASSLPPTPSTPTFALLPPPSTAPAPLTADTRPPTRSKLLGNPLGPVELLHPSSQTRLRRPASLSPTSSSLTLSSTPATRKQTPFHKPKTLILDLDETLIHSTSRPMFAASSPGRMGRGGGRGRGEGHMVEVFLGGRSTVYHVYKRPYVDYFLKKVSSWYTLVIFTASMQEYADPVIDWLDGGRGMFAKRFFRDSCVQHSNGAYIKDLSCMDEDLESVALIDNSPISYQFHQANGIPIDGWFSDPTDQALLDLLPVLDSLRFTGDVRHVLGLRGF